MSRIRGKDTAPEMVVRRLAHALGFRYRLHGKTLPGKPDLVFAGRRKVIFVHGCFWHRHTCRMGRREPKTRQDYWTPKRARNAARDQRSRRALRRMGWSVLVVWECQTRDTRKLAARLREFLG